MTQTRVAGRNAPAQGPSRRTRSGSITLTGRGAAVVLFAACFLSLLIAAWTGWDLLADALFVMSRGLDPGYAGNLGAVAVHRHGADRGDRARPRLAARAGQLAPDRAGPAAARWPVDRAPIGASPAPVKHVKRRATTTALPSRESGSRSLPVTGAKGSG